MPLELQHISPKKLLLALGLVLLVLPHPETNARDSPKNMSTKKKNLDLYLGEIFKQFIAIKDDDSKRSQEVFKGVFEQVKQKMGEKCNYFGKYSSEVLLAGSVYDGIKVTKLDEFDMDLVIRLPINYNTEIEIENDQPGFVKLKIGEAFDLLDKQQDWEKYHKVTRDWRDTDKYFLQNKFRHWMHGIVQKALNDLDHKVTVNDVTYLVTYKESGPAYTLNIQNDKGNEEFKLDVDLVPVIRFQYPRWPEGYRTVEESIVKNWLVVPKPNKGIQDGKMKNRCWRLSFQDFERDMMKGCQQLKTTIRLVKKLRDRLQMKDIASYYIKTLFLWKIHEKKEKKYWQNKLSVTFRIMVEELYKAIKDKNIPYFWHEHNNLIANLKPTVAKLYAEKLKEVLDAIDSNDVDKVVSLLLTTNELQEFKKSEFYEKQLALASSSNASLTSQVSRQESVSSNISDSQKNNSQNESSLFDLVKTMFDKLDPNSNPKRSRDAVDGTNGNTITILKSLNEKVDALVDKVDSQTKKLEKLELAVGTERDKLNDKMDILLDKINEQNDRLKNLEMCYKRKGEGDTETASLQFDHKQISVKNTDLLI